MYVPPLESLLRRLDSNTAALESGTPIGVPGKFLKLLLQLAVAHCDFNEDDYRAKNPDVNDAVIQGGLESGFVHFIGYGYFEGRLGGITAVDEAWYLRQNPDVAAAVNAGAINSATDHFYKVGAAEGRSPNSENELEGIRWKDVLVE